MELAVGALEPAVEHVYGVLARVGEPDRAERVLHDRAQERERGVTLARGVQGVPLLGVLHQPGHQSRGDRLPAERLAFFPGA
jgi:hypothetical protein